MIGASRQEGIALIITLFGLALLTLLGLTISFNAITELKISQNHQSSAQALAVAEEGLNQAKEFLRRQGLNLDEALAMNPQVPNYGESNLFIPGTYGYRYPIQLNVARRLRIFINENGSESTITSQGTKDGRGIVTRAQIYPDLYPNSSDYMIRPEAEIRGSVEARKKSIISYFAARITNNLSNEEIARGGSPLVDRDNRILIRSVGVARSLDHQAGGIGNNSVAVLEALLKRDRSADVDAPLLVDAPGANAQFSGNSFLFDGYNHPIRFRDANGNPTPSDAQADITAIRQEGMGSVVPQHGLASPASDSYGVATIYGGSSNAINDLNAAISNTQADNFIGRQGQITRPNGIDTPSLGDITAEATNESSPNYNEDAAKLLEVEKLKKVIDFLRAMADVYYPNGASFSGSVTTLGTIDRPQITFVEGDLEISGNGEGYGIIVTTGKLKYSGAFNFVGVILAVGAGDISFSGANKSLIGGMLVANIQNGNFGTAKIDIGGNSDFYYSGDAIRLAINRLPFQLLAFREVRSEYELDLLDELIAGN